MKKLTRIIVLIVLASCTGSRQSEDVTAEQLEEGALAEGARIASLAQEALSGQLKKAIADGGIPHAVQFCNLSAYPIVDTLTTGRNATIKRASLRLRNPQDAPTAAEKEILEQYQTRLDDSQELQPVVEMLDDDQVLYAQPILINNPLCLNCHGTVGEQMSQETYDFIKSLYPEDNAMGHQLGDLRGIWSITFPREDLIAYINQQP